MLVRVLLALGSNVVSNVPSAFTRATRLRVVAETLVNRRAGKLGGMRMRQELQAKGLSPEVVADTMEELKNTELARAQAIWLKKFGQTAKDAATRNRQARFLATRGFSGDVVRQVVSGLGEEET